MKPNFALFLSDDRIRLLHRSASKWRLIGEADTRAENLADELAFLRRTASALEPGGVRCKLVLPDALIRYQKISTPGATDKERREAALASLKEATPYAVEELAFDIAEDGDETQIAAIARETLAEAEAFAVGHRMHPVSFL